MPSLQSGIAIMFADYKLAVQGIHGHCERMRMAQRSKQHMTGHDG
jgi:hypothetical protein